MEIGLRMARPIEATKKERIGYETLTVLIPWRIKDKLDKLPKGQKAQFVRDALDKAIEKAKL